ncbi:ATP-binding protein [Pedobacter cryophilus]|uniref:ATP-binding protein n=1 Tax=Pedobacter cryophilus TaxID=2571271 RepID=A0A4U1C5W6_9SPHI|nr:AAA family ATPase [Pedobacter cryophilus]TKB98730.1 ATP-binding protein [Pedobacter cryophilus]
MEKLFQYQAALLQKVTNDFNRYLFNEVEWQERFVGIKGLRGVGKTTLLLQHLKYNLKDTSKHLYVTLDHPWFYNHTLFDLAQQFHQIGGQTLLVDEVHKLKDWSSQIKIIYDGLPDLQLIFTSSSALDLYRGEADLSRRVLSYELAGLSFREYLSFFHQIHYPKIDLTELLQNHIQHAQSLSSLFKPLSLFPDYLKKGYFPFSKGLSQHSFEARLIQTMEVTLNEDLAYIDGYNAEHIFKIKKLLGILAESVPFTANVSAIADKLEIGRNTIKNYLHALEKAGLLHFLNRDGKGISLLQKPDKIYLENTNLSYALKISPDLGTLRETFVLNQLINYSDEVFLPKEGDISINEKGNQFIFEIGGKGKSAKQIQNLENAYVIADDIETGFMNKIPLYLFGFLY